MSHSYHAFQRSAQRYGVIFSQYDMDCIHQQIVNCVDAEIVMISHLSKHGSNKSVWDVRYCGRRFKVVAAYPDAHLVTFLPRWAFNNYVKLNHTGRKGRWRKRNSKKLRLLKDVDRDK